jgi:HSP20 family molecular chaperone IbpA
MHEWDYGDYERTVPLPAMFHGEVSASLGHGQLAVRVARSDGPASTDADPTVMTDG